MANEFVIKNGLIIGGGGLQMSGSLQITGSLSVSSVTNAGTDTDKFLVLDTNGNVDFRTGAEVLSDIGGAGIVDTAGTPANNQIAIFTDSNTIEGSPNFKLSGSGTPTRILVLDGVFHSTGSVGLNGFVSISGSSSNSSSRIGITADSNEGILFSGNTGETKSAIRLSNFYTDGYSIGRFISPGPTNTLRIGPDVVMLGNLNITGSFNVAQGIVTPIQTYVDFKSLTQGSLPWSSTTDLMPIDASMGVWTAPTNGFIEKIYVSPENPNATTDDFDITLYKNGVSSNTKTQAMGSPGTNVVFTFGAVSGAFSANDRISLYLDKNTNDSDFYAVQVVFRLQN
jgi:hypothetical protein